MEKVTRKKTLGSFPAVGVVVSVALALFVIGLFGMLMLYSQQLEVLVRENIRLQVYLRSNIKEAQRLQIQSKLLALPYVSKQSKEAVTFVSKDEAAKRFIAETGEDFTKFLGENPLKDAYLLTIDPAYHTQTQLTKIKAEIQKINGVFQVYYVEGIIESVNENVAKIGIFLGGLILVMLLTVALLVNSSLRLALFSQRFLIRSMQLVGAKPWFIQRPFLFRSIGYGMLGAVLAALSLWGLSQYAQRQIPDMQTLHQPEQFIKLVAILVVLGMLLSTLSTFFSIRKYLKMSLDELY